MINRFILILLLVVVFSSCRTYRHVYSPSPANNPFFNSKGDAQLAAYYSGGSGTQGEGIRDKNEGFDIQGAYAVGKHFAITGSYFFRKERDLCPEDIFDTSTVDYRRNLADIGAGFFIPMNENENIFFNVYGGLGFGKFSIRDVGLKGALPYTRYHNANVKKWFLQSSFNFLTDETFAFGINLKFSFLRFGNISTNYEMEEQAYFSLDRLDKRTFTVFEPSMNAAYRIPGMDWLKVEGAFGFAASYSEQNALSRSLNGSIGLVFDVGSLSWKKIKSADTK